MSFRNPGRPLAKLAVKAAIPATIPPIKAVNRIIAMYEPPRGKIEATLVDKMCRLATSITDACRLHKANKARKADRKEDKGRCWITRLTTNEATAMIHHGKNKAQAKLNKAVSKNAIKNFIMVRFLKTSFSTASFYG